MLERGLHHKIWARPTLFTNAVGNVYWRTNTYTEVHSGISYLNPATGLLEDSSPDFVITPQSYAVASKCQHQLIVSSDVSDPQGVLDCSMPDGRRLRTGLVGLYVFSPVTGKSLQLAAVKSCAGEQSGPNEITFPDVFDGMLKASLRIRNERGGYHHDLLLNERFSAAQLDKLAALGFDANMRLEVWTEFLETPAPCVQDVLVATAANAASFAEPNTFDATVDFGAMRLGLGRSFIDGQDTEQSAPVYKQWLQLQQRVFLIESASYSELAPLMEQLPESTMTVLNSRFNSSKLLAQRIPPPRIASKEPARELAAEKNRGTQTLQIARSDPVKSRSTKPRLVLDYTVLNGTLTNLTLHADGTWFVSGPVIVAGNLTLQGNCVVKLTNTPSAKLSFSNLVCQTGPYRMASLTSWCDDSVGEQISGSNGNPTNTLGALYLEDTGNQTGKTYQYLRLSYAGTGLSCLPNNSGLWHCQFVRCATAVQANGTGSLWLRNLLFSQCNAGLSGVAGKPIYGEHLTVDGGSFNNSSSDTLRITNSIFVGATSLGTRYFDIYHFATNSSANGVFQSVGAANYYLPTNSTNRFKGRTEIDANLLADLRKLKTTYPPLLYSQTNVSGTLIFHPQNESTNSQPPDLGFAYDRLDYCVCGLVLTNAALTVSPGTVIGTYRTNGVGYGIGLHNGAQVFCEGSPTNLVHIVVYNTVQEQSMPQTTTGWRNPWVSVCDNLTGATPRLVRFRFTDWSTQTVRDLEHIESVRTTPFAITDCQFHSGYLGMYGAQVQLTNLLFERSQVDLEPGSGSWQVSLPSFVRNNLFIGGGFGFWSSETNSLLADNLFDGTGISFLGSTFNAAYNAFVTNASSIYYRLYPTNATDIILAASPAYQAGPLGNYYQLASSVLINADTTTRADQVGMYHYTTTTNLVSGAQIKETNSWLDCGLHYVAVDANGSPIDTDGGGVFDFIENANGDGSTNNVNESNWRNGTDDFKYLLTPQYLRVEYRENPWGVVAGDPLQGGNEQPRFYWVVDSIRRAQKQLAYQIIVGTDANGVTNNNVGDMWDSGKVYSDQTIHVEYDNTSWHGKPLQSGQRLWWKVRTWDPYTGLGKWSTNGAFFQMGLLSTNDWKATWLTTTNGVDVSQVSPIYRKAFAHPTNDIKQATVYVSAKGAYELYIDGQRVGQNILAPEWTDYNVRVQYQTFDATAALMSTNTDGTNHVIGAVVAEGWYSGSAGRGDIGSYLCTPDPNYQRYTNCTAGRGRNQLLVQLEIKRINNSVTSILTDNSWTCSTNGPIRMSSVDQGETYAVTNEQKVLNWATSGGQTSTFKVPVTTDVMFAAQLVPQPNDPIRIAASRRPIDMWTSESGGTDGRTFVRIFDLGQVVEGWCAISLINTNSIEGTVVKVRHCECLRLDENNRQMRGANVDNHTLYTVNEAAAQQETYYILSNAVTQVLQPHFTYHSFRFVEVAAPSGMNLDTNSLVAYVIRTTAAETGTFTCSHKDVNQLFTNILWTLRANLFGVFSACSDRCERSGWLGDTDVFSQTACFLMDMAAMYTKCIRDIRDDQYKDLYFCDCSGQNCVYYRGAYSANNPYAGRAVGDLGTATGGVIKPWQLYLNYGDTRMLKEHYDSAANWMVFLLSNYPSFWVDSKWLAGANACNGDTFNEGAPPPANKIPTDWPLGYASVNNHVYGMCHYAHSADILAGMSGVLRAEAIAKNDVPGAAFYEEEFTYYTNIAFNVRSNFQRSMTSGPIPRGYVDYDATGTNIIKIGYGAQTDCAQALYFNMVPDGQRSNCAYLMVSTARKGISDYNASWPHPSNTKHLSTGIFDTGRAMVELTKSGQTATAYDVLLNYQFPSWMYLITNGGPAYGPVGANYGATTIWERWNGWVSGSIGGYPSANGGNYSSFNQVWNGSVGEWIFRVIGGINPDDTNPGFENVIIYPQAGGGITNASVAYRSIHGTITASWTNTSGNFFLSIAIPANITASVYLPTNNFARILEGGQPATNSAGVLSYRRTNDVSVFQIGSGSYGFGVN